MNVVLVTDAWRPQMNGVVTTLEHVRDEVERAGHKLTVFHPGLFRTVPCPRYPEIRLSIFAGRRLRRLLDDERPDAIHIATEGPLGIAARRHCGPHGLPFTTSYHTQFPLYLRKYAGLPPGLSYRFLRWFHGAAKTTLVPTASIQGELVERGFTGVRVWTRGVETDLFRPLAADDPGPVPDLPKPIFAYVGRVAREKNIETFLAADLPGSKLVVGDGPLLAPLERQFPKVRFVGRKRGEELARHYAAADVFVFPSRTDTFGIVIIEALACGVPVAAYPVAGPKDIVQDGISGVLDEDLATAARMALAIDSAACQRRAREYTWERCGEIFLDALAPISWPRNARVTTTSSVPSAFRS